METLLLRLERALWGWPLLVLLLGSGIYMSLRLRLLPLRRLPLALKLTFRRGRGASGGVTPFGALCTALSAAVGTGNIVGVATALSLGGPGALAWMELSALTGLGLKYAEGVLAVRYRCGEGTGKPWGGPFAYISLGLGPRYRPFAAAFAVCGALAGLLGVGTFVQVGSVSACLAELMNLEGLRPRLLRLPWGLSVPLICVLAGLGLALLAAAVMLGGMERVSRLSSVLVPLMGGLYGLCCIWILLRHARLLPELCGRVLREAFTPAAAGGGLLGTAAAGVSRGVFSHEAGLGTAPMAAASARGVRPWEQGLISMTAVVFDTLLICTLTGLVILVTGAEGAGTAAAMTAFSRGLPLPPLLSRLLVFTILGLFAFTTVVGWSCYGTACLRWLAGDSERLRRSYLLLYAATVAAAPLCSARVVWTAANLCNGLMAVPNVLALLLLSGRVAESSEAILDFPHEMRYNQSSF